MLKKERWIVYPLLMLSLFSSLVGVQVIKAQQEIVDVLTVRGIQVVNEQIHLSYRLLPKTRMVVGLYWFPMRMVISEWLLLSIQNIEVLEF